MPCHVYLQDGIRTFDDFLKEGLVEYLDVNEENNAMVRERECSVLAKLGRLEGEERHMRMQRTLGRSHLQCLCHHGISHAVVACRRVWWYGL